MSKRKELLFRVYFTTLMVVMCALLLSFRAVKINVVEGNRWSAKGDSLYLRYFPVHAERGDILARDGRLLATTQPLFDIRMDFRAEGLTAEAFRAGVDSLAYCLAKHANTGWSQRRYRDYLIKSRAQGERYLLIRRNVNFAELEEFQKFPIFRRGRNRGGFIVEQKNIRDKPYGMLAERTIGYVREGVQPVGLEGQFDSYLAGEDGSRLMKRVDHGNTWIPVHDQDFIEAVRGADLITTIDVDIQDIAEDALMNAVKAHNALYGTAIVMEVSTGAIRAVANLGAENGAFVENYNYAIGTASEPGSTFKIASVMAMLEDGYTDTTARVDLNKGYARFYNRDMYDSSMHGIDSTDMRTAFEISSNVGIAKLVQNAYGRTQKAHEFIARLKQFGLDRTTGIEVPGEGQPQIKEAYNTEQQWSGVSLPWMSIGYELKITPLQMLSLYSAIANDGKMMKPYLAEAIRKNGRVVKKFHPEVAIEKIASNKTIATGRELLEGVVLRGTAHDHQSEFVKYAGKTGTAVVEYYTPNQGRKKYQATFAGYFPARDPVYSCLVMIYDPKQGVYYGSQVALPAFREIAEGVTALSPDMHETEPADMPEVFPEIKLAYKTDVERIGQSLRIDYDDNAEGEWVDVEHGGQSRLSGRSVEPDVMPDLRGMGLRDAVYMLENAGYRVSAKGVGKVTDQSVRAGTRVSKGAHIQLVLS